MKVDRHRRMKDLSSRLNELYTEDHYDVVLVEITDVKLALNLEADIEELFWE